MGNISKLVRNKSLWDIHCHILPDVDDGSRSMDMSMDMLSIAYDGGIRNIIVTPHHNRHYQRLGNDKKIHIFNQLKEMVQRVFPDMKLYLGSEVMFSEETIQEIKDGKVILMAGSVYVLVEFHISVEYSYIKRAVDAILRADRLPIVAHAERYGCLMDDIDKIEEIRNMGAYIQINSSSVTEKKLKTRKYINKLFKWELVDFVASDSHDNKIRVPNLEKSYVYIARKFSKSYADKIFIENPSGIVAGAIIGS